MNIQTEFTINGDEYYIESVHIKPVNKDSVFEYTMTPEDLVKYIEKCPSPTYTGL